MTRIGLCGRNAITWPDADYALVKRAGIETLKMMSNTDPSVFIRLRRENPGIEFIVRLYDDRFGKHDHPEAMSFVGRMAPVVDRLKPYATKFEIHNEPNHVDGIEGWGPTDDHAKAFRVWYGDVLTLLHNSFPWASFGFPGLALNHPHRDIAWLDICRDVIEDSDWLGCHCYWQFNNMLSRDWGLRFKLYHKRFPKMPIEITEFGDSTPDLKPAKMAHEYTTYYKGLQQFKYLGSASAFIASSPDPAWAKFAWMKEGGEMLPVVAAVGDMERVKVEAPKPKPKPVPTIPPPPPIPEPDEVTLDDVMVEIEHLQDGIDNLTAMYEKDRAERVKLLAAIAYAVADYVG